MRIYSFKSLPSTQRWLIERVEKREVEIPCAVIAEAQTDGIGSRNNRWIGEPGNFFASFALERKSLPQDLPLTAVSIYFMYLIKEILAEKGADLWLKWPNDLYVGDKKAGGCVTTKKGEIFIVGIGVNLRSAPPGFAVVPGHWRAQILLERFLGRLQTPPSWKQIFSNYSLEFGRSKSFYTHIGNQTADLRGAVLQSDGSLMIGEKRVVSLR